jgi:hypothetical protein
MHRLLDERGLPSPILDSRGSSSFHSGRDPEGRNQPQAVAKARRRRDRVMHNQIDDAFNNTEHGAGIRKPLRREPTLRNSVLMAPTRGLAALGVTEDDYQLVQLL